MIVPAPVTAVCPVCHLSLGPSDTVETAYFIEVHNDLHQHGFEDGRTQE